MMNTAHKAALADAFEQGVERGIELTIERVRAIWDVLGGQQETREMLEAVLSGDLTPELLAERLGKPFPLAPGQRMSH